MPHAAHFLERLDRLPRSLTDLALDLYRDEARVRGILHYAHLPEGVERVALALGDGGCGPFIVVTRDGKFVTALGAEMSPGDLPVLTRSQVDTFSARVVDSRKRFELASEIVPPGKDPVDVLSLLRTRPWALAREEVAAIAAWVPFVGAGFLRDIFEMRPALERSRSLHLGNPKAFRRDRRVRTLLEEMWGVSHGLGARLALSAMTDLAWLDKLVDAWELPFGIGWYATDERIFSVAARGAWASARMGKGFLPLYKEILAFPGPVSVRFDAALALTAIGIRHSRYREDARRIVATFAASEPEASRGWARYVVAASDRAFDDPEGALNEAAAHGEKFLRANAGRFPQGSPHRFSDGVPVPRELGLLATVNHAFDSLHHFSFLVLPWVAKLASPEELYYPEEMARRLSSAPSAETMSEVYARVLGTGAKVPVARSAPKTGRNEACGCGSGRKFKKCCGA